VVDGSVPRFSRLSSNGLYRYVSTCAETGKES